MRRREQRLLANRSPAAVFLCWHSISDAAPPYLAVPPELFDRQLALLRRLGFRATGSGGGLIELALDLAAQPAATVAASATAATSRPASSTSL